ncbi:hypothetical protein BJV82DRAFT_698241 [Fennellomyces sp. T-0311]|nr:hypothetical protein BJV82DRAFT_698241 [Fennellomyces sp. T-0311]
MSLPMGSGIDNCYSMRSSIVMKLFAILLIASATILYAKPIPDHSQNNARGLTNDDVAAALAAAVAVASGGLKYYGTDANNAGAIDVGAAAISAAAAIAAGYDFSDDSP